MQFWRGGRFSRHASTQLFLRKVTGLPSRKICFQYVQYNHLEDVVLKSLLLWTNVSFSFGKTATFAQVVSIVCITTSSFIKNISPPARKVSSLTVFNSLAQYGAVFLQKTFSHGTALSPKCHHTDVVRSMSRCGSFGIWCLCWTTENLRPVRPGCDC